MTKPQTVVGIHGEDFTINGAPTHAGRTFQDQNGEGEHSERVRIEGLLFNVRAVQATFDDANPATRDQWAYPDTGEWDCQRNVDEFCAALPEWREHGVLAFTVNFQGGGAIYRPEVYDTFDNNGFSPAGYLKPGYAERMRQVIQAADALGMVVIAGLFYGKHVQKLDGEEAIWRAAHSAMTFLETLGARNTLIELANELNVVYDQAGYSLLSPHGAHRMLHQLRAAHPDFFYGASLGGMVPETGECIPGDDLIDACDYILLHGNGCTPQMVHDGILLTREQAAFKAHPKPLMINEDSPSIANLDASWPLRCGWGYYDQGYGSAWEHDLTVKYNTQPRETTYDALSGYQTPPVNWGLNTPHKRAFFSRVKQITGA